MISNDQTDQNKMKKEESSFKKREIKHAVKKMKSKRLKGVTVKGVLKWISEVMEEEEDVDLDEEKAHYITINRKNEKERKAWHKSVEKDKRTSGRHEGETGVRDEVVQTDSMMGPYGSI